MRPCIKVCIPVYDIRTWDESLARACIEDARNAMIVADKSAQAVHQKLDLRYTHWLFVDHDVGFTAENIDQLLARDKDVISGAYRPKDKPEHFVGGQCDDYGRVSEYVTSSATGLISVDWVGGGFLLIKRGALEKSAFPWFWKTVYYLANRAICVGEDIYACLNFKRALLDIYLDCDVVLNHEVNRYAIKAV
jgi:hypothetical protein